MPKGKPKKDNPALYEGSPGPSDASMARQVAAHRRGGTHKVRDEHKTGSMYDTYNYKELVDEAKERGIYRKDMKKVEMAWALKHNDEEKKRAERDAVLALQRKQQEARQDEERRVAEKQKQIEEKLKRRIEKKSKRERDESVSDDTLSDADIEAEENMRDEYKREKFGQALSDESWDSTSTESSAPLVGKTIKPDCRLRLFEWPYEKMPSLTSTRARNFFSFPEPLPRHVPYAPFKITTTSSKQKLVLPGLKYPPGVNPDFVPILNAETRTAARNGHLVGPLRKATIENGTHWAQRTLVQGWNAHMYFHLGSRNETKALADTYTKWSLENRKLLRVKGKGNADPVDRAARHAQRQRNKAKKTAEVYEASLWRPGAMCYVPSYLDYGHERGGVKVEEEEVVEGEEQEDRVLENLFFIRFPGCDVPHYYFWTREGEWGDPGRLNPAWEAGQVEGASTTEADVEEDAEGGERHHVRRKPPYVSRKPTETRLTRVHKTSLVLPFPPQTSLSNNLSDTIATVEHHLYSHGLHATLTTYRQKWHANGKAQRWKSFAAALPTLWPSGQIPNVPPVESRPGASIAVKLAMIDFLKGGGETLFSPLHGREAWTRDDNRGWDVVEVKNSGDVEDDEDDEDDQDDEVNVDGGYEEDGVLEEIGYETDDEALYRRSSMLLPQEEVFVDPVVAWLETTSPRLAPPTMLMSAPEMEMGMGLEEWEERYLQNLGDENGEACPFCCMRWVRLAAEEQARHMLSHSTVRPAKYQRISGSQYALASHSSGAWEPNFDRNLEAAPCAEPQRASMCFRPSAQTYSPVDNEETSYISSLHTWTVRRHPTNHPEAASKTRKRSFNNEDGLGFLSMYSGNLAKRRKTTTQISRMFHLLDRGDAPLFER